MIEDNDSLRIDSARGVETRAWNILTLRVERLSTRVKPGRISGSGRISGRISWISIGHLKAFFFIIY